MQNVNSCSVLDTLRAAAMSGDVYLPATVLADRCCRANPRLGERAVYAEVNRLVAAKHIVADGENLYLRDNYRYEVAAANNLVARLNLPIKSDPVKLDAALAAVETLLPVPVNTEQLAAMRLCLDNSVTIVTGGAGSGKTTLVQGLWLTNSILCKESYTMLCAPTGKASRNLEEKTCHAAHTVHRALGKVPDSDFLDGSDRKLVWKHTNLVVVDEASMLTIELLAGLLAQAGAGCRIVLVGDPNQLLSVGAGNVIQDLLELGVPHIHLEKNHRQNETGGALLNNVMAFNRPGSVTLEFDESFQLVQAYSDGQAKQLIAQLSTPDTQALSPFRGGSPVSAQGLCHALQPVLNPPHVDKPELVYKTKLLREGDRVILNQNLKSACNGDMGVIHLAEYNWVEVDFGFSKIDLLASSVFSLFDLAYATTIHKAQGIEYDTVILPILPCFNVMLTRNLIYTAISRAKGKLILVGDREALHKALNTPPPRRYSGLVRRVRAQSAAKPKCA